MKVIGKLLSEKCQWSLKFCYQIRNSSFKSILLNILNNQIFKVVYPLVCKNEIKTDDKYIHEIVKEL